MSEGNPDGERRVCVFVCSVRRDSYIGVLVGGDGDELRLREGESLHSPWLAAVLRAVLVHLHHMEPGLVLMERLEDHHLERGVEEARISNKKKKKGKKKSD